MAVRNILLDTNAYAAFKRDLPEAVNIIRHVPLIGINCVVLGELLGGFAVGTREPKNREELARFQASSRVRTYEIDEATATNYATVYKNLRSKGHPIPTNDIWIAATALQHDLAIFTYDAHFNQVEGIIVGSTLSDFIF